MDRDCPMKWLGTARRHSQGRGGSDTHQTGSISEHGVVPKPQELPCSCRAAIKPRSSARSLVHPVQFREESGGIPGSVPPWTGGPAGGDTGGVHAIDICVAECPKVGQKTTAIC